METLLCANARFASFWTIIHMDPVNTLFWILVWVEKSESAALVFSCGQRIPTLCVLMMPTMEDYMLVFVPQKILSLSGLLGQNILLLCHYAERKRIMDHQLDIFIFFFLCSLSPSTVCLCTVQKLYAHALSLRLRYRWIQVAAIGLEYELQHVESFTMDPFRCKYSWNDAEEDGEKRLFWYVWTWTNIFSMSTGCVFPHGCLRNEMLLIVSVGVK